MGKKVVKKKYITPKLLKHDTLKNLTMATWNFNGPCKGYDDTKGTCVYGFDCEPWP